MGYSMSRKGNCWNNAPSESFFNSLKNVRVPFTRYDTQKEAIAHSIASSRSTTASDFIRRAATPQRWSYWRTGSALSTSGIWRHSADGLEDE